MLKLDYARVVKVGFAFVIVMVFWEVYDFAVPLMLERTYGLSASWRGLIMGLDNILAVFLLPLFGALSDRSKGKYLGRRTPFILFGTILAGLLAITLTLIENHEFQKLCDDGVKNISVLVEKGYLDPKFLDPIYDGITNSSPLYEGYIQALNDARVSMALANTIKNPTSLILFIFVLLLLLISMSSFRSPAVALMPDVVTKNLRSQGNAVVNFMGGVGGFLSIGLYSFFAPEYGSYVNLFLLLVCVMFIFLLLFLWLVDENKLVSLRYNEEQKYGIIDEEEVENNQKLSKGKAISLILILASIFFWFMGYNAVRSHLSVYATSDLGMSSAGVGAINFANGLGGALALLPAAMLSTKIGRKYSSIVGYSLAVVAFLPCMFVTPKTSYILGISFVVAGLGLIIVNINTLPMVVELSKGSNVGKYTGYYYVATMAAQAITPFLVGLIMENIADNLMFIYASVCIFIALIIMIFVKHGNTKPTKSQAKQDMLDS